MNLGEKIRAGRTAAGLTQAQLAERVHVSRQAVTKWETGRGTPDLVNLQALAALFGTTVDDLLSDELFEGPGSTTERIDARSLVVRPPARHRFDVAVRAAFPDAALVQPLTRRTRLRGWRWWVDLLVQPGLLDLARQADDFAGFYLVREDAAGTRQWLVKVTDTTLVRSRLAEPFAGRKLVHGDDVLTKAPYRL